MSKVFIEETTLSTIGNAIREKAGSTEMIAPQDMGQAILNLSAGGVQDTGNLAKVLSKTSTPFSIKKSELAGITQIGDYVCEKLTGLVGIEFPNTLTTIGNHAFANCGLVDLDFPESITNIKGNAFDGNTQLNTVRINRTSSVINIDAQIFGACNKLKNIYVPSRLYNDYIKNSFWNNQSTSNKLVPYGEWVLGSSFIDGYYSFDMEKEYTFDLIDFKDIPSVGVSSSNPNIIEASEATINADNTLLTITVKALPVEGESDVVITIIGDEDTYSFSAKFTIMETLPESSYEVVAIDGATYGFELNENGFYESKNKGKSSTYAICQVNISNLLNRRVYIDCISYGENNYDFGILSYPNEPLNLSYTLDGNNYTNFKGKANPNIQTVEYTNASGECFIQIKYIKDGSGDNNNDTLQFKVRFEE